MDLFFNVEEFQEIITGFTFTELPDILRAHGEFYTPENKPPGMSADLITVHFQYINLVADFSKQRA